MPYPYWYKRPINWDRRLSFEGPGLAEQMRVNPEARLLHLGCAGGEHDRWLVEHGAGAIVGVDPDQRLIDLATRAAGGDQRLRYVCAPLSDLPNAIGNGFTGAFSIANTLAQVHDAAELEAYIAGVAARLAPSGRLLIQLLNYEGIQLERRRSLPTTIGLAESGAEVAAVTMLDSSEPGFVIQETTLLERAPDKPPEILASERIRLRAWTRTELISRLGRLVGPVETFGRIAGDSFEPATSHDLVLVASKP